MRYIDIDKIEIPKGWQEKAEKALREIENLPEAKRKESIESKSSLWKELKELLAKLSHEKCWYCETRDIRSDYHVDHFRPKNSVKDSNHQGYWWLAFSWENYRYSCTFCNCLRKDRESGTIGGKEDHFPLLDESNRCFNRSDDLNKEIPFLLDPVNPLDPCLIIFTQDGNAHCKYSKEENVIAFRRAEKSIELYHLNTSRLVEKRKKLHRRIKELIERGDEGFKNFNSSDRKGDFELNRIIKEILELTREESEYSAAARSFLLGYRDKNRDWVDMVIQCG